MLGIAGVSGCGKTTAVHLLTRMFDPDSGSVRIDGEDPRGRPRGRGRSVRSAVAVVPQQPTLFNDTVAYNI
eukprot:gene54658-56069_t